MQFSRIKHILYLRSCSRLSVFWWSYCNPICRWWQKRHGVSRVLYLKVIYL